MSEPLPDRLRKRIERDIAALRRREPYMLKRMADAEKKVDPAFRDLQRAILDSECITAADLAIIINAR